VGPVGLVVAVGFGVAECRGAYIGSALTERAAVSDRVYGGVKIGSSARDGRRRSQQLPAYSLRCSALRPGGRRGAETLEAVIHPACPIDSRSPRPMAARG